MIKFIMGMFICYILVSMFGLSVFSDMYSTMMSVFTDVKEVTNQ